jgi:hypothetical protein
MTKDVSNWLWIAMGKGFLGLGLRFETKVCHKDRGDKESQTKGDL